jgi:F-type H+-transporting ATPase subunit a
VKNLIQKERRPVSEEVEKKKGNPGCLIILAMIVLGAWAAYFGPPITKPLAPSVILPAEPIWPGAWITNTILATLIADVILILVAISAYRFLRKGNLVPSGGYNAFEALVEYLWNTVEGSTGKWARRIIPVVGTIFLLIFVANMIKLVPGFESIGYLEKSPVVKGYGTVPLFHLGALPVSALNPDEVTTQARDRTTHSEESAHEVCTENCIVVPFLRGSATDLNFTFALAVIAVLMTQVYGVWAQGLRYFTKFIAVQELSKGAFGIINFGVGFLELILEFAKILSFSFRLFGNIFAGVLLLSIIGALMPIILPPGLYLFEIFFGTIQAYVFFLLATMFMSMALVSHHGDGHGEEHH